MEPAVVAAVILFLTPIALIVALVYLWKFHQRLKQSKVESDRLRGLFSDAETRTTELQKRVDQLAKYDGILEADKRAAEILEAAETRASALLSDAQRDAEQKAQEAERLLSEAETSSKETRQEASQAARELRQQAEAKLREATAEAGRIIETAQRQAQEIAGAAYEALQNKDDLEKAVTALENVVKGYGNEYIIPSHSLLDDLAEEFSHTDAGQELKKAKTRTKLMVKEGTAASCDYVEENRKTTAINFVIDAFNGKVDSIISRVKHDNAGTLTQEIMDAYSLVNLNGKAFRNAQINKPYLESRLEELKWAATVVELKMKEREEQRAIKEQIREEEKARREYERALKEAQKDEERIKKALEQARKEVEGANAEQRAKFEAKLAELQQKLAEAEEKNQRALSMAQQTKAGHVYVISNIGSFGEDVFKIGMTRRLEPLDRIKELGDASVPFEFDVHAMIYSEDAPKLESELHRRFNNMRVNKVNYRKEFFRLALSEIRDTVGTLGLTPKFTMLAEAREYRESLAFLNLPPDEQAHRLGDLIEMEEHSEAELEEA